MREDDEMDLLRYLDETEEIRRERLEELNVHWTREALEVVYGKPVYSSGELRERFDVIGFFAPLVVVKSKADGSLGSFEFQHDPRYFFNYRRDE